MSEKLKQCPFCKGEFAFDFEAKNFRCGTCGATVLPDPYARTVNTRPIEDELHTRIAELEMKIRHNALWQASEDAEERAYLEKFVPDLKKRIAELEGERKVSFDLVRKLRMYCFNANWEYSDPEEADEFDEFDAEVCKYLSEYKVCIDQLTAHDATERQDDKWIPEVQE